MVQHRLHYFDIVGGCGDPIRNAFKLGKVNFEDVRIPFSDWPAMKNTNEMVLYMQLPIIEIDGKPFAQSPAILRYVGKLTGLYPADNIAAFQVDEILDCIQEMRGKLSAVSLAQEADKDAFRAKIIKQFLEPYYERMEKRINQNASAFSTGDNLTIADLVLYNDVTSIYYGADKLDMNKFPTIKSVVENVRRALN